MGFYEGQEKILACPYLNSPGDSLGIYNSCFPFARSGAFYLHSFLKGVLAINIPDVGRLNHNRFVNCSIFGRLILEAFWILSSLSFRERLENILFKCETEN